MSKSNFIEKVGGGLIVSCQALPGEPLYREEGGIMPLMAKAAKQGGAVGIRSSGIRDIKDIMASVDLPLIGIIKKKYEGFSAYITPTMNEVDELVKTGCDVIAVDATRQTRPGNLSASSFIKAIKEKYPESIIMADCSTIEDVVDAEEAGADFVGTTMRGYVEGDPKIDGPDFAFMEEIVKKVGVPLIAEGKIFTPGQAKRALETGALTVVVGGAITRPLEITTRFVEGMK